MLIDSAKTNKNHKNSFFLEGPKVLFGYFDETKEKVSKPRWTTTNTFGKNPSWKFLEPILFELPINVEKMAFYVFSPHSSVKEYNDTFLGRCFLDLSVFEGTRKRYTRIFKLEEREENNLGGFDGVSEEDSVGGELTVTFSVEIFKTLTQPSIKSSVARKISAKEETFFKANYNYTAKKVDELSFKKGDVLKLIRDDKNSEKNKGWFVCSLNGKSGLVPHNFLSPHNPN